MRNGLVETLLVLAMLCLTPPSASMQALPRKLSQLLSGPARPPNLEPQLASLSEAIEAGALDEKLWITVDGLATSAGFVATGTLRFTWNLPNDNTTDALDISISP